MHAAAAVRFSTTSDIVFGAGSIGELGAIARQWHLLGRVRTLEEEMHRLESLSVESIERRLAAFPVADLTVVSLGSEPLEVPHAVSA